MLDGGAGDDFFSNVDPGASVRGGDGADTFTVVSTAFGTFSFTGDAALTGVETVRAAAGSANIDISLFSQTEGFTLQGNDGNNFLQGSNTSGDTLTGGLGNDTLLGAIGGSDSLAAAMIGWWSADRGPSRLLGWRATTACKAAAATIFWPGAAGRTG